MKPRRMRKVHVDGDLRAVVDETIALFHRLAWVADEIYGEQGRGTARRGLLRGLLRYGPQTVPELARARSVARQTIQPVVDALVDSGLVTLVKNPAHARSRLVRITPAGTRLVERMDVIDARVLAAAGTRLDPNDVAITAATLRLLRSRFEMTTRWKPVADRLKATVDAP
jgi:DNA-binding MarR family transcriptional regulator